MPSFALPRLDSGAAMIVSECSIPAKMTSSVLRPLVFRFSTYASDHPSEMHGQVWATGGRRLDDGVQSEVSGAPASVWTGCLEPRCLGRKRIGWWLQQLWKSNSSPQHSQQGLPKGPLPRTPNLQEVLEAPETLHPKPKYSLNGSPMSDCVGYAALPQQVPTRVKLHETLKPEALNPKP